MSQQIFAKFPATTEAAYHLIDVTKIEAIGQSDVRQVAVIFGPTDRYYSVEVSTETLDAGKFPDAASYCFQIMETAVEEFNAPLEIALDGVEPDGSVLVPEDYDDEDDFDALPCTNAK